MDMCLNVWYRLDLRGKLKFGGTSEGVLIDAFSDGRLCSVVMEHVLPEYFQNLVLNIHGTSVTIFKSNLAPLELHRTKF